MKSTYSILALAALFGNTVIFAQTPDPNPPKSPFVHRAPSVASWTITYSYKDAKAGQPAPHGDRLSSLTVSKSGKTYREEFSWTSGQKTESWIYQNVYLMMTPDGKSIVPVTVPIVANPGEPPPDIFDYSHSDFDGLKWLATNNYEGTEKHQGMAVYRFEVGVAADASKTQGAPTYSKRALLTTDTQLPVFSEDEEVTCTYTFNEPPTSPLVPPEKYLDIIKKMKAGAEYRRSRPSPP